MAVKLEFDFEIKCSKRKTIVRLFEGGCDEIFDGLNRVFEPYRFHFNQYGSMDIRGVIKMRDYSNDQIIQQLAIHLLIPDPDTIKIIYIAPKEAINDAGERYKIDRIEARRIVMNG